MKNRDKNEPIEKKEKSERNSKFYIALLVCLAAVSAAGWSTYRTVKDFINPQKNTSVSPRVTRPKETSSQKPLDKNVILEPESNISEDSSNKKAIPYEKTKPAKLNPDTTEKTDQESEEVQAVWSEKTETLAVSYPCGNNVSKEFSDGTPVYSKTLDDWRCHEGADFKAEKGAKVTSITNGVVSDIYEDPSYGTTVVVSHDSQFTAYYSGLDENVIVKKGNRIKSGEEIGTIGKVPCELLDEPHLHLSINKNGKFIDPLLVLDKEV